jgi:D-3-phosphoglycerate dehydrogenase
MFTYQCLNPIAGVGLSNFGENYSKIEEGAPDAYLVRSANMKEMEIPASVSAIARAGAGVNNIPLDDCAAKGIVVFNTPGANANGVKELVLAGMLLASRDIAGGVEWLKAQEPTDDIAKKVEKQKKQYAGTEIQGKKLGVVGLGAIGAMVANAALGLGMEVYGYDPYLSPNAAWRIAPEVHHVTDVNELYKAADFITVHVPLLDSTKGIIGEDALKLMKDGVVVLNFARDPLVDEKAMIAALESGKVRKYVTDFVTPGIMNVKNTLIIPHLGASTEESEDNCAVMAVRELREYLENGNVINSVNYPAVNLGVCAAEGRVAVLYKNEDGMADKLKGALGSAAVKSADGARGAYGYSLFDLNGKSSADAAEALKAVGGVIRVRIVK